MNEQNAHEIIEMIENTWSKQLGDATRDMYVSFMLDYPAELVTAAVAKLAETQTYFPQPVHIKDMMGTLPGARRELEAGLCRTCLGDKIVLVQTRPPVQSQWMAERGIEPSTESGYEETAPCPDCNAGADTSYAVLGKDFVPMDEAMVRQRMEAPRTDPEAPRTREVPADVKEWLAEKQASLLKSIE